MTEKTGKNRSDYKRTNRGAILKLVATGACVTRTSLVRGTGLTKMAISKIVTELIGQGLLIETKPRPSDEPGRKSMELTLSPDAPKVMGLAIHRERCEGVLCGLDMRVIYQETQPISPGTDAETLLTIIRRLVDHILSQCGNIVSAGLCSIGPIDIRTGHILKPFYFHRIENVPVVRAVEEQCGLPVFFDHDNQSAALAESMFGGGRGYQDILFVGIGEGVGCGVMTNGKPYANHRSLPPELGHVSVDANGFPCVCGNRGCVEAYIRTPELMRNLTIQTGTRCNYETFCRMDDPAVKRVFQNAVHRLAAALVSVVNLLNSEIILLGGDAAQWPDEHLEALEEEINTRRFVGWDGQRVLVRKPRFLQAAPLIGAACNAAVPVFEGKFLFQD